MGKVESILKLAIVVCLVLPAISNPKKSPKNFGAMPGSSFYVHRRHLLHKKKGLVGVEPTSPPTGALPLSYLPAKPGLLPPGPPAGLYSQSFQ